MASTILLATLLGLSPRAALDSIPWKKTSITAEVTDLKWTGSRFVATTGTSVLSSTDGSAWKTELYLEDSPGFRHVVSNGTTTIACGHKGLVASSHLYSAWRSTTLISSLEFSAAVWTGSKFVLAGWQSATDSTYWFTSTDGRTWEPRNGATRGYVASLVKIDEWLFIAGTGVFLQAHLPWDGSIMTAPAESPVSSTAKFSLVADLDSVQVAFRENGPALVRELPDMIWHPQNAIYSGPVRSTLSRTDRLLLGTWVGMYQTPDLKNWTKLSFPPVHSLAAHDSILVAATAEGIYTTGKGIDVKPAPPISGIQTPLRGIGDQQLAYGNGTFVGAFGWTDTVVVSHDGRHWKTVKITDSKYSSLFYMTLVFEDGRFVVSGDSRGFFESTDGEVWKKIPAENVGSIHRWKNGYVGLNWLYQDSITFSNDDDTWTRIPTGLGKYARPDLAVFGDTAVLFTGSNGEMRISTDGLAWKVLSGAPGVKSIIRGTDGYVASRLGGGVFYTSPDLVTWSDGIPGSEHSSANVWAGIRRGGSRYFTAGDSGLIHVSTTLEGPWARLQHSSGRTIHGLAATPKGEAVALADSGWILFVGDSSVEMSFDASLPARVIPRQTASGSLRLIGTDLLVAPEMATTPFFVELLDLKGSRLALLPQPAGQLRISLATAPAAARLVVVRGATSRPQTIFLPPR
ncbi:MAG: hypothetical protein H6686_01305 [Fibrobacteria bacterium]|nr:hypothetical protein [Fibrobacteria bacterium]